MTLWAHLFWYMAEMAAALGIGNFILALFLKGALKSFQRMAKEKVRPTWVGPFL